MTVTRYYLTPGSNSVPPVPSIAYTPAWFRTPPAGSTDNLSRRVLSTAKSVTAVQGVTPGKPSPLPNSTAGWQLRTPAALAAGVLVGSFRAVFPVSFIGTSNFRARVLLVSADGATVRAVLADTTKAAPNSASYFTRTVAAAFAAATAVAGDLLVFELGFDIINGLGGSAGIRGHSVTTGVPPADYPFEDGTTATTDTTGTPWIEVVLEDPPEPPAALAATSSTVDVTATWSPPASGATPAGYDVRLDGGAPVDVGLATTHTFAGLTPATSYLIEARTRSVLGPSAWASVTVETSPVPAPSFEGLRLEVGPDGAAVDLLDAGYSISIRRGNSTRGVTDTLEAGTLTAVLDGPAANPLLVPEVRTGAPVRVLAGIDRDLGAGIEWEAIFTGTLDRARLVYAEGTDKADPDAYRVTLTATDVAPVLAATPTGGAVSGSLTQRITAAVPAGIAYTVTDDDAPQASVALPSKETTAAGDVRLATDTLHALAYVDRFNVLRAVADNTRPRTPAGAAADLTATDDAAAPDTALHYYALTPTLDTDALVNVLEVDMVEGATTVHTDDTSLSAWGPHADKVTVNDGLPETHADLWLASRRDPDLRPEALSFNVRERPAHLAAATLEPYTTISVERAGVLPAPVTMTVRDIEHHISADRRHGVRWLCHLGLRPPEVLATRWDDIPPALRWDDLPPGMTWDDAVRWHPYL